jgi:hypothetical protein
VLYEAVAKKSWFRITGFWCRFLLSTMIFGDSRTVLH